ncbi:MAG TPA: NAD(+)/NADH kinase [Candidatus Dormibacteraeota bacterium]
MSAPESIGFLLHPGEQTAVQAAIARAQACGYGVWTALEDPESQLAEHAGTTRLLVTVGGDGTFLYGARLAAPLSIPVLGANRGRLGFLAEVEIDELPAAISRFAGDDFRIQRRSLLDVEALGDGLSARALALNELVARTREVNLARVRLDVDGDLLGLFDSDGVVVATATGSTAYAMSAGGPPVDPRLRVLVVVPLAPHAVITRPVVLPDAVEVRVVLERGTVSVAADGVELGELTGAGEVRVRPGPDLEVVRFGDSPTFMQRLRQKFRYGVPLRDFAAADAESRDAAGPGALDDAS